MIKAITALSLCFILLTDLAYSADKLAIIIKPSTFQISLAKSVNIVPFESYALSSPTHRQATYNLGKNNILHTLNSQGYFNAKVLGKIDYDIHTHTYNFIYQIDPGPLFTVSAVDIRISGEGQNNQALQKIARLFDALATKPLQVGQYQQLKTDLQNAAIAQGYFDSAYISHQLRVDLAKHTAKIVINFNTGKPYYFANLTFQQSTFSNRFLHGFTDIKPGQAYQQKQVDQLQSNLASSGYFQSITVNPLPIKSNHTVPIHVALQPKPAQEYQIGGGYGTDTGIRGLLGWKLRYIGKEGQYITTQLQAARNYTNFIASYVIPGTNPLTDYTSINAGRNYTSITPYTATDNALGIDHVVAYNKWQTEIGLTQHFVQASEPANPLRPAQRYLIPETSLSYTKLSSSGFYKQGYSWVTQLQAGSRSLLSSASFAQASVKLYGSLNLNSNNRIFIKVNTGATVINSLNDLSAIFRFYAGGVDTVRGYAYKSLGPEDINGNLLGGLYLFSSQFNLEHRVWRNWSALVFYDVGNAFNSIRNRDWHKGAGVGTSWQSPIGTINFYLAHPVGAAQGPWRIDIGIETLL